MKTERFREQNDAVAAAQEANFLALDKTLQHFISRLVEGHTRVSDLVRSENDSTRMVVRSEHDSTKSLVRSEHADSRAYLEKRLDDFRREKIIEDQRSRFLNSLRYEEMDRRKNQISATYPGTYEWIFDETVKKPWPSFKSWLERGRGIYFIEGKAGSGKSTLMKFMINDRRTKQALKTQAPSPPNEPIVLSFFFWLHGTPLERSYHGLVSSLLYQLLEGNAAATVQLLRNDTSLPKKSSAHDWDVQELSRVLQIVVRQLAITTPLCIFLDGLDEFSDAAEPAQLLKLVHGLSLEENVKICVSSRPEQHIRNELDMAHLLRLQDLTEADIRKVVLDELEQAFQRGGAPVDQAARSILINELIEKAEGVFLWVNLALRNILRGLSKHDTFAELSRRVSRLPAGIEQLYEGMLQRLGEDWPLYQQEAALYFKICLVLNDIFAWQTGYRYGTIYYYTILANERLHGLPLISASNIDLDELLKQCRQTELRITSRCAGMLDISWGDDVIDDFAEKVIGQGTYHDLALQRHPSTSKVDLSHRTVYNFLLEKPAGRNILACAPANDVEIFVRAIEIQLILLETGILTDSSWTLAAEILRGMANTSVAIPDVQMYELLQKVHDSLYRIYKSRRGSGASNADQWEYDSLTSTRRFNAIDFLGLTLEMGIRQYFEHEVGGMLQGESAGVEGKHLKAGYKDYLLLLSATGNREPVKLLPALLKGGANPNATFFLPVRKPRRTSPWIKFLTQNKGLDGQKDTIENFLAYGARLDELILVCVAFFGKGLAYFCISNAKRGSPNDNIMVEFNAASLLRARLQGTKDEAGVLQHPSVLQAPSHQQVLLVRSNEKREWMNVTPQASASLIALLHGLDPLFWGQFDFLKPRDRLRNEFKVVQFIKDLFDQSPMDRVNPDDFLEQRGYYKNPTDPAVLQGPIERFEDVTETCDSPTMGRASVVQNEMSQGPGPRKGGAEEIGTAVTG